MCAATWLAGGVFAAGALFAKAHPPSPSAIELPDDAYPESITSARDGTLYISNAAVGGVLRVAPRSSQPTQWIKPGAFGTGSLLGVLADERSKTLWACSNDRAVAKRAEAWSGSALIGFDLRTGEGKIRVHLPGPHTLCNDIAIGGDGAVYVSDTRNPRILRLAPGTNELAIWSRDPAFTTANGGGPNGIAFAADGRLYLDTYPQGDIFRITIARGVATKVEQLVPTVKLALTDGLRLIAGSTFVLAEASGRVDRVTIDGGKAVIEPLAEDISAPTGVTTARGKIWVVESQLAYFLDPAKHNQSPMPFRVRSIALGR